MCKQEAGRASLSVSANSDRSNNLESATMAAYEKVGADMDKLEADLERVSFFGDAP